MQELQNRKQNAVQMKSETVEELIIVLFKAVKRETVSKLFTGYPSPYSISQK